MIEFNGWITIWKGTDGEDLPEMLLKIVNEIKNLVAPLNLDNQFFEVRHLNEVYSLFIGGNHNHDDGYSADLKHLLNEIGKLAPGSYGLVYVRLADDELLSNEFKIYKLAKGKVNIENDKLLSPCNPTIED